MLPVHIPKFYKVNLNVRYIYSTNKENGWVHSLQLGIRDLI